MNVLGVWDGHDAGAVLLVDGHVRAAMNEERFTRRKLEVQFPAQSIAACASWWSTRSSVACESWCRARTRDSAARLTARDTGPGAHSVIRYLAARVSVVSAPGSARRRRTR